MVAAGSQQLVLIAAADDRRFVNGFNSSEFETTLRASREGARGLDESSDFLIRYASMSSESGFQVHP
jgi:hypothetical protein